MMKYGPIIIDPLINRWFFPCMKFVRCKTHRKWDFFLPSCQIRSKSKIKPLSKFLQIYRITSDREQKIFCWISKWESCFHYFFSASVLLQRSDAHFFLSLVAEVFVLLKGEIGRQLHVRFNLSLSKSKFSSLKKIGTVYNHERLSDEWHNGKR